MKQGFLCDLVDSVIDVMGASYIELKEKETHIKNVIKAEEDSFGQPLDKGLEVFDSIVRNLKNKEFIISGEDTFKLYDTYGFPIDLTKLMAKEKNISIDEKGFLKCMNQQKKRSRSNSEFKFSNNSIDWIAIKNNQKSIFVGYSEISSNSKIVKFRELSNNQFEIVLDKTSFYAESGGQIGDVGYIKNDNLEFKVTDTQNRDKDISHVGILEKGQINLDERVVAEVNQGRRLKIRSNHTATHILHESLKQILGKHIQQAGSLVTDKKLRFDLTHYEKISDSQIIEIENKINHIIRLNCEVSTTIQDFEKARKDGVVALFGEKYEDQVRVVDITGFSMELCGGTHVLRTGDIGIFKIISESSLSTGIRRIEAITGQEVLNRIHFIDSIIQKSKISLKTTEDGIIEKTLSLINKNKELEKKMKQDFTSTSLIDLDRMISKAQNIKDVKIIFHNMDSYDGDLKQLGDQFRNKCKNNGIIVLSSIIEDKINIMCSITDNLTSFLDARDIAKKIGKKIDGGGGGKIHIATAGGKNNFKISEIFNYAESYIKSILLGNKK